MQLVDIVVIVTRIRRLFSVESISKLYQVVTVAQITLGTLLQCTIVIGYTVDKRLLSPNKYFIILTFILISVNPPPLKKT